LSSSGVTRKQRRQTQGRRPDPAPPNLKGNYEGSCVICFRGADTGLGLEGEAPWLAAFLIAQLGIAKDQAIAMIEQKPPDTHWLIVQVCESCSQRHGVQVGLLAAGVPIPMYRQ
jgi:hypothetical protein